MFFGRKLLLLLRSMKIEISVLVSLPFSSFSPFLWNLVVDSLLSFTKDKIPCDLQGFADDLALLATTEAPKVKGLQCFDADTLREMTQKSLEHINSWWTIPKLRYEIRLNFSELRSTANSHGTKISTKNARRPRACSCSAGEPLDHAGASSHRP